jgi:hypothetical protein
VTLISQQTLLNFIFVFQNTDPAIAQYQSPSLSSASPLPWHDAHIPAPTPQGNDKENQNTAHKIPVLSRRRNTAGSYISATSDLPHGPNDSRYILSYQGQHSDSASMPTLHRSVSGSDNRNSPIHKVLRTSAYPQSSTENPESLIVPNERFI